MPENLINITVTPAQLMHLHAALIDYTGKTAGVISALSALNLPTDDAENLWRELRSMSAALADLMED